ncbi:MAG: hypothetical protein K2I28_08300 [Muribaculaceae bacterium]|nr:hypothetical protein [Muribaculaceae bacterium]
MTKTRCMTLGKFEENSINEDSVIARKNMIAVSDGAGGGGLFADRWSRYLLKQLPTTPLTTAEELDEWIGRIWEHYYDKAETSAQKLDAMALDKFYDEGSFATLAAAWKVSDNTCRWMTYGDSVVFHYDYATKTLRHSFSALSDFNQPPYLINCKDELNHNGFKGGEFQITKSSIFFVASDSLSHYILMMYELSEKELFNNELTEAIQAGTKNSNLIQKGLGLPKFNFGKEVIEKLRRAVYDKSYCAKWLNSLYKSNLLALDDYSLAIMYE